jgi:hypothetical protein
MAPDSFKNLGFGDQADNAAPLSATPGPSTPQQQQQQQSRNKPNPS